MLSYILAWLSAHIRMPGDESGQDLAEYALLLGLIALVVILGVTALGVNLNTVFSNLAAEIATWFP